MKRRVIFLAGKTAVLSLPIKWVRDCNIQKGDELEINEQGSALYVYTKNKPSIGNYEIEISNMNSSLVWRYLNTAYKLGASEINIKFNNLEIYDPDKKKNVKTMDLVRDIINELVGLEIIKQGTNFCIVKEISLVKEEEFDPVYRRMFLTLLNLAKDSLESIEKKDREGLENISKYLDPNINRLFKFCLRILNKENMYIKDVMAKTVILHGLERIGDYYKEIAYLLLKNKTVKLSAETLKIYKKTNELLEGFYDLHYKIDGKKIEELHLKAKVLKEDIVKTITNSNSSDSSILSLLKEINNQLREIVDWILPLERI